MPPPLACDCHAHVCGPAARYPYWPNRVYTPPDALLADYRHMLDTLGVERAVLVQPSVYGTDNSSTLFGMKARGAAARGVAVIDDKTTEAQLDAMQADGFRGVRLNLATGGVNDPNVGRPRFTAAVERMKARGWDIRVDGKFGPRSAHVATRFAA